MFANLLLSLHFRCSVVCSLYCLNLKLGIIWERTNDRVNPNGSDYGDIEDAHQGPYHIMTFMMMLVTMITWRDIRHDVRHDDDITWHDIHHDVRHDDDITWHDMGATMLWLVSRSNGPQLMINLTLVKHIHCCHRHDHHDHLDGHSCHCNHCISCISFY